MTSSVITDDDRDDRCFEEFTVTNQSKRYTVFFLFVFAFCFADVQRIPLTPLQKEMRVYRTISNVD